MLAEKVKSFKFLIILFFWILAYEPNFTVFNDDGYSFSIFDLIFTNFCPGPFGFGSEQIIFTKDAWKGSVEELLTLKSIVSFGRTVNLLAYPTRGIIKN